MRPFVDFMALSSELSSVSSRICLFFLFFNPFLSFLILCFSFLELRCVVTNCRQKMVADHRQCLALILRSQDSILVFTYERPDASASYVKNNKQSIFRRRRQQQEQETGLI